MSLLPQFSALLVTVLLVGKPVEAKKFKPIVETKYGKVQGFTKSDADGKAVTKFLGIRYAKAPVGNLRFMKPEKAESWDGVMSATEFGNACIQMLAGEGSPGRVMNISVITVNSEDCLFINVFVPGRFRKRLNKPRAVMVWIHGGAFIRGNSNLYDGGELAISQDVIVVSFNYRVGLFGFMASDDDTIPGNQGLYDQNLAFKWVYENIAAFGGDVSKITIFGQSAGGSSVVFHMLSPLSDGLFSRAIAQSSANGLLRTRSEQFDVIKETVSRKCKNVDTALKVLECVQNLSTEEIIELHDKAFELKYSMICTDGEFLPDDYHDLLRAGKFNRNLKVMLGYTGHDGDLFVPNPDWKSFVREGVDIPTARKLIIEDSLMFMNQPKSNEDIVHDLLFKEYINCKTKPLDIARGVLDEFTDALFGALPFLVADSMAKFGVDVYMFRFDHLSNYLVQEYQANIIDLKAGHIHELLYLFGAGFHPEIHDLYTKKERLLEASVKTSFGNFANHRKLMYLTKDLEAALWKKYTCEKKKFLVFTTDMTEKSMKCVPELVLRRAVLWNTVIPGIWGIHGCEQK